MDKYLYVVVFIYHLKTNLSVFQQLGFSFRYWTNLFNCRNKSQIVCEKLSVIVIIMMIIIIII